MIVTKKAIPRRTVLRGLGVTIALPLLDSMVPAREGAGTDAGGAALAVSASSTSRTARSCASGRPHKRARTSSSRKSSGRWNRSGKHLTVLSNLSNYGENGHSVSSAMWLSGTFPRRAASSSSGRPPISTSPQKIGQESTFPSMEFATEDHSSHLGSCAGDFLCSYMSTISWASATQPLPMEINPRVVFERMFGGDRATPAERRARLERNTSILDAVMQSATRLCSAASGRAIATKLTEYLDNVREIERRIEQAEKQRNETGDRGAADAGRRPRELGRARQADVRADGTRLSRAT